MKHKKKFLPAFIYLGLLTVALPAYAANLPSYFDWRLSTPTDRTSAVTEAVVGEARVICTPLIGHPLIEFRDLEINFLKH